jgi:uncharacterized membrane protein YfcA
MFGLPAGEIAWLVAAILVGGVVTGLLAGMFGIGGGAVIVPVLYEVFRVLGVADEVRMQLCVGTSLAIIVPTTIRSYRAHNAKGLVMREVLRLWVVPASVAVVIGALLAAVAPAAVFKLAFVVIAGVIALNLLFGRGWRLSDHLPGRALMSVYGFGVGLASSLMGVSGGSLSNMMQMLHGVPIHNAVATSAGLGVPLTLLGAIGYVLAGLPHQALLPPFSIGFVSLAGLLVMAPVSSFTAPYGARLAHGLPRRRLEIAFGIFLLLVAVRFIASLV